MAMGTLWTFSARFCAVTTISASSSSPAARPTVVIAAASSSDTIWNSRWFMDVLPQLFVFTTSGAHSSIDDHGTARDEAGRVRCQEKHRARDLHGLGMTAERDQVVEEPAGISAEHVAQLILDAGLKTVAGRTRMNRVDADAARRQLLREAAHEAALRVLWRGVG